MENIACIFSILQYFTFYLLVYFSFLKKIHVLKHISSLFNFNILSQQFNYSMHNLN